MKKILLLTTAIILGTVNISFAEPIVELAAPRAEAPKILEDGTMVQPKPTAEVKKTPQAKTKAKKKYKKHKPKPIKVDYDKVSKLIEYGYYDNADVILDSALSRNPKDIKAQSLWAVSLAKQCKLDPAQKELDELLKKYPDNSDLHYAQGIVYFKRTTSSNMYYRGNTQKLFCDALTEFKKAITLDKTNAKAYNAAGVASLSLGNPADAKDYFQKALCIDKNYSMAIDNLGTMDFQEGKIDDAQNKFQQALSFNTQNTTAMYHLAQVAMQKKDYTTAITYLNNALAINSNSPAIFNLIGKAYKAQGNEAAAINAFKKSIMVKPEFTQSYIDLAKIYERRDDGEFAIEQLKTALSIDPNLYEAKLKIADIALANGKYSQSIKAYGELVGIDNYNAQALKGLANSYYYQAQIATGNSLLGSSKELTNALNNINKAIEANPQDLELHLAKLKLAKITNQPELTRVELNKIISSPNCDLINTVVKGEAYITLNDYQNAGKFFDSAMQLSQSMDEDFYLTEIFIYHKQYKPAEKILQKILSQEPQNQDALNSMDYIQKSKKYANNYFKTAQSFIKSKNQNAAMEYLSRSLSIDPSNSQAHLLLAELCEKQKDYQGALVNYKAYLSLEPKPADVKKIQNKIRKLENEL